VASGITFRIGLLIAAAAAAGVALPYAWRALRPAPESATVSSECDPPLTGTATQAAFAGRQRERVRIVDNSLVTDTGEILRAAHGNTRNPLYISRAWWTGLRDRFGLNTLRLDARITTGSDGNSNSPGNLVDVATVFDSADIVIDRAAEAGMYVILANFTSCCGDYNVELNKMFWKEAAARYKDRPHVLFEIQNEPVEGINYSAEDVAFQEEMFRFVRALAPDTHIILWSAMYGTKAEFLDIVASAKSIDYSNASVGIHPYWHDRDDPQWENVGRLRARYPVMNTEFSVDGKTGKVDTKKIWDFSERSRLAWAFLDLRATRRGLGNYGDGVLHPCEWSFSWPIPAR
jgi:hypothetical protein